MAGEAPPDLDTWTDRAERFGHRIGQSWSSRPADGGAGGTSPAGAPVIQRTKIKFIRKGRELDLEEEIARREEEARQETIAVGRTALRFGNREHRELLAHARPFGQFPFPAEEPPPPATPVAVPSLAPSEATGPAPPPSFTFGSTLVSVPPPSGTGSTFDVPSLASREATGPAPPPSFTFGSTPVSVPPPSGTGFTFGAPSLASREATGPAPPPSFTFGSTPVSVPPPSGTGFTFGVPSLASREATGPAPPPSFTFGSTPVSVPPPSGTGFTFGAPSLAPSEPTGPAPAFTFGFGSASTSTPPAALGMGFSVSGFGSGSSRPPASAEDLDEDDPDPNLFAQEDFETHQAFMANPEYADMVEQVHRMHGPVQVITGRGAGQASWGSRDKTITITDKFKGPRRASAMMFELTNAFQEPRFEGLKGQVGEMDENEYAHAAERIEYEGLQKQHRMMQHGIQNLGWPARLDRFGPRLEKDWQTFEGYLKTQEKSGHTNIHRSNYRDFRERREDEQRRKRS